MKASTLPTTVGVVDPDADLVRRSRAGDLAAFEQLVERHRDVVFRVAARVVGREEGRLSVTATASAAELARKVEPAEAVARQRDAR